MSAAATVAQAKVTGEPDGMQHEHVATAACRTVRLTGIVRTRGRRTSTLLALLDGDRHAHTASTPCGVLPAWPIWFIM